MKVFGFVEGIQFSCQAEDAFSVLTTHIAMASSYCAIHNDGGASKCHRVKENNYKDNKKKAAMLRKMDCLGPRIFLLQTKEVTLKC